MKRALFFLTLSAIFSNLTSCTKEKETIDSSNVKAGIYFSDYVHYAYPSPLSVQISWDSQNLYGNGQEFIDVNLDGVWDLKIELNIFNTDSFNVINNGFPNSFLPSCNLTGANGIEFIGYTTVDSISSAGPTIINWSEPLEYRTPINVNSDWVSQTKIMFWKFRPFLSTGLGLSRGNWFYVDGVRYIGFRLNGNYGWVSIDATNPYDPRIIEFAMLN